MMMKLIFLVLVLSINSVLGSEVVKDNDARDRMGKIFSLFSVVQFNNDPCISNQGLSTGSTTNRNGTCFTTSECSNKGGSASGSCASGFGVCCVFTVSATSGGTVNYNDTYIQNPSFPSAYSATSSVSYTVQKCSDDICYLRLDFEQFTNAGPADTQETNGGACVDSFTVTTSSGQQIPTICGDNTGQHIYVDMGALASDTVTLAFNFGTSASASRIWDIKVAQIPCNTNYGPPNGCLQYQTGLTGRITTFNFNGGNHLASQSYSSCIRQEAGYCCVQYQVCSDPNSWSIDSKLTDSKAGVDSECTLDYVQIDTSASACIPSGSAGTFVSKYCLDGFNSVTMLALNSFVCDCTAPFEVNFRTDALVDDASTTSPNAGVCLEYTQVPC